MADEETATGDEVTCECVKWHSPKSPIVLVGDTPVCLVTAHKVQELLGKYAAKGKVVKADQKGASKYQKELSEKVYAAQGEQAPAPAVQVTAEVAGETEGSDSDAQEPVAADA